MKAVVDPNVFVSSFFGGHPRKIIDLWKNGAATLCFSKDILEEYVEVLGRMGLEKEPELKELLDLLARAPNVLFTSKAPDHHAVPADPDDDKFIACALALLAEVVITGDKAIESVGSYGGIRILTPARFLEEWAAKTS
ncbi:MAG: putative toxin-antitoxin system toxin component, PIN family [Candidatus Aminicenantes bacterium]|nr:putative toxin-antitoxin system toxin component, PIN family [Candidatus Aminicenantes bacterium]